MRNSTRWHITGTTETILDLGLVQRLALATRPDSATSLTKESVALGVSIPDLQLGSIRIKKLESIAMDLSQISRELGIRPDVVIGMDVLHRASFMIDYEAQLITFERSSAMAHSAALAPGSRFVLVNSSVLGMPMTLKVDTGFNGVLLYGNRLEGRVQPPDTGARIAGVGQASMVHSIDAREVRIGNWRALHLNVYVIDGAPRDLAEYDGLLGPRLLGAQRLSFDFDHHILYWD